MLFDLVAVHQDTLRSKLYILMGLWGGLSVIAYFISAQGYLTFAELVQWASYSLLLGIFIGLYLIQSYSGKIQGNKIHFFRKKPETGKKAEVTTIGALLTIGAAILQGIFEGYLKDLWKIINQYLKKVPFYKILVPFLFLSLIPALFIGYLFLLVWLVQYEQHAGQVVQINDALEESQAPKFPILTTNPPPNKIKEAIANFFQSFS